MKMNKKIIIVGVGETAELALDYFRNDSEYEVAAFVAELTYLQKHPQLQTIDSVPVIALDSILENYPPNKYQAFVAMSYVRLNHDRAKFYNLLKSMGYSFASYVSSRIYVGSNVSIGENCFIFEDNILQRNVTIGDNVILWSGNHIGHRSVIKDHVFLSSQVAVSGFCVIEEYSFLGINSCVGDNVTIATENFIGGGVTIMKDTKPGEIYRAPIAKAERLKTNIVFGF